MTTEMQNNDHLSDKNAQIDSLQLAESNKTAGAKMKSKYAYYGLIVAVLIIIVLLVLSIYYMVSVIMNHHHHLHQIMIHLLGL